MSHVETPGMCHISPGVRRSYIPRGVRILHPEAPYHGLPWSVEAVGVTSRAVYQVLQPTDSDAWSIHIAEFDDSEAGHGGPITGAYSTSYCYGTLVELNTVGGVPKPVTLERCTIAPV